MKEILITGASGLLGGNLCYLLNAKGYSVTGILNNQKVSIPNVNLIHVQEQSKAKIDCLIHCAAKTNVDDCERQPDEAQEINVALTEAVIDLANRHNALLIHISTDAVYRDSDYLKNESAPIDPLSIYAKSKWEAEVKVRERASRFFIIRTNLFGYNILNKYSLSEWVYYNLSARKAISGFYDVLFSPILVNDLFDALHHLITKSEAMQNEVLNIGSIGSISKFDFICRIAELFGLDKTLIKRTSVREFGFTAPRASNSVMNSTKFESAFQYMLPTITESLQRFYDLYKQGYPQHLKTFNIN